MSDFKFFSIANNANMVSSSRLVSVYTDKEKAHRECFYLKRQFSNPSLVVYPHKDEIDLRVEYKLTDDQLTVLLHQLKSENEASLI